MRSIQEILEEIDSRIESNKEQWKEASKLAGHNCPGANQPLGAMDELQALKEWILSDED